MILEDGFGELDSQVIEGKLDSETNPYAMGKIIEKTDQFMFGPSIMVAPFYERHATERKVQLPLGNWYDFYTGTFMGNNKTITVRAGDLKDRTPLFVKENAVIPLLTQTISQSDQAYGHPLELRYYGRDRGTFDLTWVPDGAEAMGVYISELLADQDRAKVLPFAQRSLTTGQLVGCTRYLDPHWVRGRREPDEIEVGGTWSG